MARGRREIAVWVHGAVDPKLTFRKNNAAQAEHDRLTALVSPEAAEIFPGGTMSV